jgi:uncharacterized protein (DUF362 family)
MGGLASLASALEASPAETENAGIPSDTRVVLARAEKPSFSRDVPDRAMVQSLLRKSMLELSGEKTMPDAWRSVLGFSDDDVIGIKINVLGRKSLMSSPVLVGCIVEGLKAAGVPEDRIVIWDRKDAELESMGWDVRRDGEGVRCYGTLPGSQYEGNPVVLSGREIRFSRILTEEIDVLINVPILKDHGIAGLSGAMKNHYGSFDCPWNFHDNLCDPHLASLNSMSRIREKERLILVDALRPLCDGGPQDKVTARWEFGGLLAGVNPVAADWVGLDIVDGQRKVMGIPSLRDAGRPPTYLETAAGMGVGWPSREGVDLRPIRV